jgi:hypothetical protein
LSEATSKLAACLRETIAPFESRTDDDLSAEGTEESARVLRARSALTLAAGEHEEELLALGFLPSVAEEAARAHAGRYHVPRQGAARQRPDIGDETRESLIGRTVALGRLAGSGVLDGYFMPEFQACVARLHALLSGEGPDPVAQSPSQG